MATKIRMENPRTGENVTGFYGFSWTTLIFGAWPALFRKDFITFAGGIFVLIILGSFTFGVGSFIAMIVWAFMYNKYYTTKLIRQGFMFAGMHSENELASSRLGFTLNSNNCKTVQQLGG